MSILALAFTILTSSALYIQGTTLYDYDMRVIAYDVLEHSFPLVLKTDGDLYLYSDKPINPPIFIASGVTEVERPYFLRGTDLFMVEDMRPIFVASSIGEICDEVVRKVDALGNTIAYYHLDRFRMTYLSSGPLTLECDDDEDDDDDDGDDD